MAPSAEDQSDNMLVEERTPRRNITFAVNYEVSLVDQFLASQRRRRLSSSTSAVESVPESTAKPWSENNAPNIAKVVFSTPPPSKQRRSAREKKKDVPLSRSRVRYDMAMVPVVQRNPDFLKSFPRWWMKESSNTKRREGPLPPPFQENTSVLWIPTKRTEWEDSLGELTAVCTSAALRRYRASPSAKPFHAPLSRDYIRDRLDIDDPLHGFQLRHGHGGWLQGFILWTNFTTWTHDFCWNSQHPMSGITDHDGGLSEELEAQPRSGDPHTQGIVFPTIAEIALVGGLGCGEYMLRLALDSIRAAEKYDYVVLQATDQSKTFYERYGFVRVGAVCRYRLPSEGSTEEVPLVGYRHWTHANESETSLQKHGGPSYMMCLKLPPKTESNNNKDDSFLSAMMALAVEDKPTVEQLGGSLTPGPKALRHGSSVAESTSGGDSVTSGAKRKRRGSSVKRKPAEDEGPASKRRKLSETIPRELVLTPPRAAESVYLAMPPKETSQKSARKKPTKKAESLTAERTFYSVRGPDGRFVTVSAADMATPSATTKTTPKPLPASATTTDTNDSHFEIGLGSKDGKPVPIDPKELRKQKVKSYPRSRVHYYNRVVKPKSGPTAYFFVVHYAEDVGQLRLAPMICRGRLTGKREGRPRYQCDIRETDANLPTVAVDDYDIVPATMVMKTPVVAHEAWDVEE